MSNSTAAPGDPFEGAPPHRLQAWIGLIQAGNPQLARRALVTIGVTWLPLAILTVARGDFIGLDRANVFVFDLGPHTRFLLAAPLLVLAESICAPRLAGIARQFNRSGLIAESDLPRYNHALSSTGRLAQSRAAEIVAIVTAYALLMTLFFAKPVGELPGWFGSIRGGTFNLSAAGAWALFVSHPLLLVLLLGWFWRVLLWARFLWLMNRLDLRLIPAHPDRAGGLKFVGTSLQGFLPLGFILGLLAAGPLLNQVLNHGAAVEQFRFLIAGVVVLVVALLSGPLLVFTRRLFIEQHRGMFEYGALAIRMGEQLERKWLAGKQPVNEVTLGVPDFSATTDLYSVVANVYAMRLVPLEIRNVVVLASTVLLPFLPLLLLAAPFDVILGKVAGLLL